jgi:hypothetical protein
MHVMQRNRTQCDSTLLTARLLTTRSTDACLTEARSSSREVDSASREGVGVDVRVVCDMRFGTGVGIGGSVGVLATVDLAQ